MIYNTEGESSFFSLSPVVDTRLVYRLDSQLHHPHRSPMGLSIKPCGGQSGGGWALPLLLLPSHSAEPHPPSLHTTKIKGMERKQATHPRQMWWTHVLESHGPGFQSQGLELPVPGLPLPEQLILTPWASVSSQTWRLKQANALKAFSKVLASSQGWTLRKREVTVTSMGLAVKMDVDKLCYRVISQAFCKGKSLGNSYSLGLYIKPVLAKQNFRYL